jgi:hypothetical protein
MDTWIDSAGINVLVHIACSNGGKLPETLRECRELPAAYGIALAETRGRHAKLVIDREGDPVLFLNPRLSPISQQCQIIHDVGEYIAIGDYPGLFDDLPRTLHYSGGDHPKDIAHRIAKSAEGLYKLWLARRGYPE